MKKEIFAEGEVILGGWSRRVETSHGITDGYIKLYLPDDAMLDILARLGDDDLRGNKKSGGKLFYLRLHEYDGTEPERLVDMEFAPPPEPKKLSQIAAIICSDENFPKFAKTFYGEAIKLLIKDNLWNMGHEDMTEQEQRARIIDNAATLVRYICSIGSRKELDTNEIAADIFKSLIKNPFNKFCSEIST